MSTDLRSVLHSQDRQDSPGTLADAKGGETSWCPSSPRAITQERQ